MNPEQIAASIVGIYVDESTGEPPERRRDLAMDALDGYPTEVLTVVIMLLAERLAGWLS